MATKATLQSANNATKSRSSSVDDFASLVRTEDCPAFFPRLEFLRRQPCPVGDFAEDPERGTAAIGPGGVAGEFLVGHVQ